MLIRTDLYDSDVTIGRMLTTHGVTAADRWIDATPERPDLPSLTPTRRPPLAVVEGRLITPTRAMHEDFLSPKPHPTGCHGRGRLLLLRGNPAPGWLNPPRSRPNPACRD